MNINDYIEQHSNMKINDRCVTIELCVPPQKIVEHAYEESDLTEHVKLFTKDIKRYLEHKKVTVVKILQNNTIDNSHPEALAATWKFSIKKKEKRTRKHKRAKNTQKVQETSVVVLQDDEDKLKEV